MQIKILLFTLSLLIIFSGCGKIEDEVNSGTAQVSYDNYTPATNNYCATDLQNSAGCFGNEPFFAENQADKGYWALYKKSDNYKRYYNVYYKSYQFISDGSVKKRFESEGTYRIDGTLWGVNEAADTLSLDNGEKFTLTGRRYSGSDCYDVTHNSATYKMCSETAVDDSKKNGAGYYGDGVSFGNYNFGDIKVVGEWSIDNINVTLGAEGNTSNSGEWGVSADAKVITIDSISYIVNRYPDNGCIDTYTLVFNTKQENVRLCKL